MGSSFFKSAIRRLFFAAIVTFASAVSSAQTGRGDLLFVSNDGTGEETAIEDRLDRIHQFNVVVVRDDAVTDETDFSSFDLVLVTGFAPDLSNEVLAALQASGAPILVLGGDDLSYAVRFDLIPVNSVSVVTSDTVESVFEELTELTRYLAPMITVTDGARTMAGVSKADLKPGTTPLIYSDEKDAQVAVFLDPARRIAVTGLGAVGAYTPDGWRLFDLLVAALQALRSPGPDPRGTAQSLSDSGLLRFIDEVLADPASPSEAQVRKTVWEKVVGFNLLHLAAFLDAKLAGSFQNVILSAAPPEPYPHHPRCSHPGDLWFLGEAWFDAPNAAHEYVKCTRVYYPDCPKCVVGVVDFDDPESEPVLFADWPDPVKELDANWRDLYDSGLGDYYGNGYGVGSRTVRGTDLGISVSFHDQTLFFMGDTWNWCYDSTPGDGHDVCPPPEVGNDAIAVSSDDHPSDGLDITVYAEWATSNLWHTWWNNAFGDQLEPVSFVGLEIPGVVPEPHFSTPCGATVLPLPFDVAVDESGGGASDETISIDTVLVWFTTASVPKKLWAANGSCAAVRADASAGHSDKEINAMQLDCDQWDTRKTPTSWVGCSFDGLHFWNCYEGPGGPVPFSRDGFRWRSADDCARRTEPSYSADQVARFTQADPVALDKAAFDAMCGSGGYGVDSPLCTAFYDGAEDQGGVLLFGTGRPAGRSPLFMAYIEAEAFGQVHGEAASEALRGRPVVSYYDGAGWSPYEAEAAPLPLDFWRDRGMPCDEASEYTITRKDMVDEAAAKGEIEAPLLALLDIREDGPAKCYEKGIYFAPEDCGFNQWTVEGVEQKRNSFGIKSVQIIGPDQGAPIPQILILHGVDSSFDWFGKTIRTSGLAYRTAPLHTPWNISPSTDVNRVYDNDVEGYGAYIIDDLTEYVPPGDGDPRGRLEVWHTISSWKGVPPPVGTPYSPYGVYTRKTTISWPPDWPLETGEGDR